MYLQYLIFDASDDGEGTGTWEAMASAQSANLPDVLAEVQTVLATAERSAPGPRGPLDDGGVWDADVQQYNEDDGDWTTVTLTLTGPWEWGEALMGELS